MAYFRPVLDRGGLFVVCGDGYRRSFDTIGDKVSPLASCTGALVITLLPP